MEEGIQSKYNCYVYCFEPIDAHYKICENKFKSNEKIKVYKTGLANDNKLVDFHVSNDSSSIHIGNGLGQFNTMLMKIDDFMSQENINYVDLLKMNIEGAEYDLLEHIIKNDLLDKFKNIQVQFHENPYDGWEEQYKFIINNLNKTHHLTYHFEFKFENWEINK
jgi:FkbM family methyltransferase